MSLRSGWGKLGYSRGSKFENGLGYQFKRKELLERALTHRSKSKDNFERLEFLGDSVLGFVIAAELYVQFPDLSEGKLTRLRATLVRKETLARLARSIEVGPHIRLGSGEMKSGGNDRDSILADCLEAVIGAVYLDSGIEASQEVVLGLYKEALSEVSLSDLRKDAKTRLQEYLQKNNQALPRYDTVKITGKAHDQHFSVECQAPGMEEPAIGEGNSRRIAEQAAAEIAYRHLMDQDSGTAE